MFDESALNDFIETFEKELFDKESLKKQKL